jgi:hypothetical protein
MLTITPEAYNRLSTRTQAELLKAVFGSGSTPPQASETFNPEDFDWEHVVDFSPGDIEAFMETLGEETTAALRVIAERGPCIEAGWLDGTGIESYASFQRSTTRRTRSITGRKTDFLLTWDDWEPLPDGQGHYAVSATTFRSLRVFFELD